VVTHADEVGKVGAQHVVDLLNPSGRIVLVVEVALVHHSVGPFLLDQLEYRAWRVRPVGGFPSLVADERELDGSRGWVHFEIRTAYSALAPPAGQ
jgi:hypothetical protein